MHPDQLYSVRQLQHQDLLAEAEQARVRLECAGDQSAWSRLADAMATALGVRRTRGASPKKRAESSVSA
jgi:hypothetical protein